MNHEACRERLVELAYGELSRRDAAEVERHLSECEGCKAERARLDATVGAMRRLEAPPASERGDAVLLAAARAAVEERRRDSFGLALRGFGVRIAAGSAFALLAVFLLVNVKRGVLPPTEEVVRPQAPAAREPPVLPPLAARSGGGPGAEPPDSKAAKPGARSRQRANAPEAPPPESAAPDRAASLSAPPAAAPRPQVAAEAGPPAAAPPQPPASPRASKKAEAESAPRGGAAAPAPLADAVPAAPAAAGSSARQAEADAPAQRARPKSLASATGGPGPIAREIERRHAAGDLSEAQKRFEPCPGGDVRRTAWIDREQRVLKLAHERADGTLVEEWFDDAGRLREALVRGRSASGPWVRHITIGDRGEETERDASGGGLAPEVPPPALVRRDPGAAFFSGPGCDAAKRP